MDWAIVEELFHELEPRSPEERRRALSAHTAEVRNAVDELLACASDGAELEQSVRNAALLALKPVDRAGPYRLERPLGQGGMGTVYLAHRADDAFEKRVAVKFVHQAVDSPMLRRRFEEERRILARLEHPYIARLLDAGATADGRPWLAMEYVEGESIVSYVTARSISLSARIDLLIKVCEAVQYAHRNLVVHRDLKPGNILVGLDGQPRLLDFGIAKLLDPETPQSSGSTMVRLLTPDYASPEQVQGKPVTIATDVYSLGAVLFEVLSGDKPFHLHGLTPRDAEKLIMAGIADRPSTRNPEWGRRLTGDLDNIVLKAMRAEPGQRYGSVRELADDLRRFQEGSPVTARDYTAVERMAKLIRRHRALSAAVASVAVALAAGSVASTRFALRAESARQLAVNERAEAQRQSSLAEQQRALAERQTALAEERNRAALASRNLAEARLSEEGRELTRVVQDFYSQIQALPGATPVRMKMMQSSVDQLERLRKEEPSSWEVRDTLGAAYFQMARLQGAETAASIGQGRRGLEFMLKSLAVRDAMVRERPNDRRAAWEAALTAAEVGRYYENLGEVQSSDRYLDRSVAAGEKYLQMNPGDPPTAPRVASLYVRRGLLRMNRKGMDGDVEYDMARAEALTAGIRLESTDDRLEYRGQVESMRGQFYMNRHDWKAALPALEESLAIREKMLQRSPHDTTIMSSVLMSSSYVAKVRSQLEGPSSPGAAASLGRMVALAEAMAAADPADRTAQYNVAMTQIRLAESRFDNEDAAGALAPAERSIAVFRQMRAAGDQDVTRQRNFGPSLVSLGNVYLLLGRAPDARNMFREAFDLAEKETARNPRDVFSLRSGVLAAMGLAGAGSTEPLRFADLAVMLADRAVSVSAIPDLLSLQSRAHGHAALAYDKAGSESGDADLRTKARELAGQCRSEMEKLAPGSFLKWTDGGRQRRLRELIAEQ